MSLKGQQIEDAAVHSLHCLDSKTFLVRQKFVCRLVIQGVKIQPFSLFVQIQQLKNPELFMIIKSQLNHESEKINPAQVKPPTPVFRLIISEKSMHDAQIL